MSDYVAPVRDMEFAMKELGGIDEVAKLPGNEDFSEDLAVSVLEEAAKFANGVLSPLNVVGDREGAKWTPEGVKTAPGWTAANTQFSEAGWGGIACETEFGGQGMPKLLATPVMEMWKGANMAFSLCSMLTNGAIEALTLCGNEEQKQMYLPKMVSGEWTGTMNLTEPNAGSDLAAVRAKAEPVGDGTYKIFGQKIFITYGDHDMTENIIHLVLARLPDAPEGVKGISLFVVPKFMVNPDGSIGERNDAYCVSIEHKLGIHGSPTAVMAFGDKGGAIGTLVGEPNRGLEYMFIMMNAARFAVGMEGLGLSERAYQQAVEYARERIQGTEAGVRGGPKVPIIRHADVRRMLMLMKSQIEAMRALSVYVGAAFDHARSNPDEAERKRNQGFVDLMIPVVKGWFTENSVDLTSLGVQVHGGMGFIEETGAAQHFRDSRITPIYEGTTGIQATDLIGRKIAREKGVTVKNFIAQMRETEKELEKASGDNFAAMHRALTTGISALDAAVDSILATYGENIKAAQVGSVPFLKLLGIVSGGWLMAKSAMIAQQRLDEGQGDPAFYKAKITTARFYADHVLSQASGLSYAVINGAAGALDLEDDAF